MTDQANDTAAIEIWARMLNAADIHVYGPEHQTWQRLTPKLQEHYRKAARWLFPRLTVQPQRATGQHRPPCIDGDHCGEAAHCPPPADPGIRDAARQASGQQPDTAAGLPDPAVVDAFIHDMASLPDPTTADDPVQLRWGLGDVLHGDDDTVTVCLSGPAPDRRPYWLELDAERAAALRKELAPDVTPAAEQPETCRSVTADGTTVLVRGAGDWTDQDQRFMGEIVAAAKRKYEAEHPAAPAAGLDDAQPANDLPERLAATLTERFTALGNPFSGMRTAIPSPDGWPASREVSPRDIANVLRELLTSRPVEEDETP